MDGVMLKLSCLFHGHDWEYRIYDAPTIWLPDECRNVWAKCLRCGKYLRAGRIYFRPYKGPDP